MAVGTAGGLLSSSEASANNRRMIEARNAATMGEVARSKAYGEKSRGIFDTSLDGYSSDPAAAQAASGEAIASNAPTDVGSITSVNAPKVVADREGAKIADVFTRNAGLDKALGNLKGYDNNTVDNGLRLNQSGRDIDMIGDFAKTSAGVNAIEQRAAENNARRAPSPLGQILQTAGQVGSFYGGKGGSIFPMGRSSVPNFAPMTSAGAIY